MSDTWYVFLSRIEGRFSLALEVGKRPVDKVGIIKGASISRL